MTWRVDFHRKDLQEAIENGAFPKWKFAVQILEEKQEHLFDFECVYLFIGFGPHGVYARCSILDATKVWPEKLVPLEEVGELVLNRTVDEFFTEVEQVSSDCLAMDIADLRSTGCVLHESCRTWHWILKRPLAANEKLFIFRHADLASWDQLGGAPH